MSYLEKQAEFVRRLHGRTGQGDINWYATETDGVFQAEFPEYLVQIFQKLIDENDNAVATYISIFTKEGRLIDTFDDRGLSEADSMGSDAFLFMADLYENARRIAMGLEQTLDILIDMLGQE